MTDPHYGGNIQNEITHEEHDHTLRAKRVNVVAGTITASSQVTVTLNNTPTVYAVVNTSAAGQASVVLDRGHQFIGIVTVANPGSLNGNLTLDAGSKTQIVGNVTLSDPKGFIGLVTVVGSLAPAAGNVTLDPGSKTGIVGNVTLTDSKAYIGLTTVTPGTAWPDPKGYIGLVTVTGNFGTTGNVTLDPGSRTGILGNLTLTDSKTYIGLVTATANQGTSPWVSSLVGNVSLNPSAAFIGLVTATIDDSVALASDPNTSSAWGLFSEDNPHTSTDVGQFILGVSNSLPTVLTSADLEYSPVAVDDHGRMLVKQYGNTTLSDSKAYIGLTTTTLGVSDRFIGLVTVVQSSASRSIVGNVTITDSKTYIGLVTATIGNVVGNSGGNPAFSSLVGNVTLDAGSRTQVVGNLTTYPAQFSFYQQSSLVSGYVWYGLALPGSNPTTANFKIQRETLNTGEVLFADGTAAFIKTWSAASLSSISYS